MSTDNWPALLVAIGGLLAVLGTGIKWLLNKVEARIASSAVKEQEAREALSKRLNEEIYLLRGELVKSQLEKSLYLRRIYVLEAFIHRQPGIEIPDMNGWPPQ